jgi:predicted Zn finger-like uncharacterized protein
MPLMTRCKHCRTVFRVTPEQLRAHGGQVRCGRCLQVFNGLEALVPDVPPAAAAAAPALAVAATASAPAGDLPLPQVESVAAAAPASATAVTDAAAAPADASATDDAIEAPPGSDPGVTPEGNDDAGRIELLPEPDAPVARTDLPPQPAGEPVPESAALQATDTGAGEAPAAAGANPFMQASASEAQDTVAPARRGLALASVLLAAALGVQAIYFYRGELAARHPLARQWLDAACSQLGCAVPLPRLPKAVLIEASDLQLLDPARPDRIQLTATLRNHAGHAVAYPALDLVLTNANDHTLARRIFLPAEYLGNGRDPRSGFAAHAELTVQLALDTGDLGAAGFRLAVLAAPR